MHNRLSHVDRATGEPIRRYQHDHPGSLIHVDVKKLGNIPDGGGWRYVGRPRGARNRATTVGKPGSKHRGPQIGTAFVRTVIDDPAGWPTPRSTMTKPPSPRSSSSEQLPLVLVWLGSHQLAEC